MQIKKWTVALLSISLALSLIACGSSSTDEEIAAPRGTAVEVAKVSRADMASESIVSGQVSPKSTVAVIPMLAGQVTQLNVSEGDTVKKNQVLFKVDTSSVTSSYGALQDSYNATKIVTDESINTAKTNLANTEALFAVGAASQFQLDQARSALTQAQASQTAQLAQIQSSMNQIGQQASYGTVKAPCDGLVTSVSIVQGGIAGQSGAAITIAEGGVLRIVTQVSETLLSGISVGDAAQVTIASAFNEPKTCVISDIAIAASAQNNLYTVQLYVPEGNVAIGAFAEVKFFSDYRQDAVQVPTESIMTDGTNQYVYTTDGDIATRIDIETGLVGREMTEITSGLQGGETLVVTGQSFLTNGAAVRVVG